MSTINQCMGVPGDKGESDGSGSGVEAVVFDIGGVLLDWNPRHLYRKLFDDVEAMERFLNHVCTPAWHEAHDRGLPTEDSCADLAKLHPQFADQIWAWARRGDEMVAGEVPGTKDVLRALVNSGVACFALTNMEAETFPRRRARFSFFDLFDGVVVSGIEGLTKPDPEIFRRLLRRFGLRAESTLFIDDNEANIAAAAQLGMRTVRFESAGQLRKYLLTAGILDDVAEPMADAGYDEETTIATTSRSEMCD
jgi:2-haloacid dehalogenase